MNFSLARLQRLEHGQFQFLREHFDRRRRELEFAALGFVRLRDDGGDWKTYRPASASRLAQDNSAVPMKMIFNAFTD